MLFIHICIFNSYVNLCQGLMSISKFYNHVNFTLLQSCQVNFNLFLLTAKWLVRIQEQLVPVNLFLLMAKWLVRIQEQLVPVNLFLLSAKWLVRIQEQLVLPTFLSAK